MYEFEKQLIWIGSSKKDLMELPIAIRKFFGHALNFAQMGERHDAAKVLKGFAGAGVIEIVDATDISGGNYDYTVYSMSDVTGGEIEQLTHLKGMTTGLKVVPGGKATFVNGGAVYLLDISTQATKPL